MQSTSQSLSSRKGKGEVGGGGGVVVFLYMSYIGICGPKGVWFISRFGHK